MPPPKAEKVGPTPGRPTTTLSDTTALARVRVPSFQMPPPHRRPLPRVMVSPSISTVAPALIRKTRLRSLPLTASRFAPGPAICTSSVMRSWPLVRATVPRSPPAKSTTSAPGLVLAAVIAARSDPAPASARFETVKVVGTARSSSGSTPSRAVVARFRVGGPLPAPDGARRVRANHRQDGRRMGRLLARTGLRLDDDGPLGAQTERRGGAGPVGGLLGGKDPTGRCPRGSK